MSMVDHLPPAASWTLMTMARGEPAPAGADLWATAGTTAIAAVIAVAALLLLWRAVRSLAREARLLVELGQARRRFSDLPAGRVTLRGRVVPLDAPITTPFSGDDDLAGAVPPPLAVAEPLLRGPFGHAGGVYLAYHLDRWDSAPDSVGVSGRWVRERQDEVAIPFGLFDGQTTVAIDPEGARVMLPAAETRLAEPGVRYCETTLVPGDEVVVRGVACPGDAPLAGGPYRQHGRLPLLTSASLSDPMVLAEPTLARQRAWRGVAWSCLILVPVPMLLALGLQVATGRWPSTLRSSFAGVHDLRGADRHGKLQAPRVFHDWPRRNSL
jgi:hypothetical protein